MIPTDKEYYRQGISKCLDPDTPTEEIREFLQSLSTVQLEIALIWIREFKETCRKALDERK